MADCSALLGGYKVGLISASLSSKGQKESENREENIGGLLLTDNAQQPTFVAVKRKKPKKDSASVESEKTKDDDNQNKNTPKKKRKHSNQDDLEPTTKKQKKFPLNKSADDDPERLSRTIFVGNLSTAITRKELKNFFRKYGDIESTRLRSVAVPDFQTSKKLACIKKQFNRNRDSLNGYVVFKDKESTDKATKSNGEMIGGFHIRVDKVNNEGKQYDHKRSIFVGNLAFDIKEHAVSDLFAICGDVENVRIIRDAATGIGKGFGYVLFKDGSSVSLALKMNNAELCGRKIRIQQSQENPKTTTTKGNATGNKKFSGMQAKEKFYHKRKTLKQQKNLAKKKLSGLKKNKKTTMKHKK